MKEKLTLFELKTQVARYFTRHGKIPTAQDLQSILDATPERIDRYLEFLREKEFIVKSSISGTEIVNPEKYRVDKPEMETEQSEFAESMPFDVNEIKEASQNLFSFKGSPAKLYSNFRLIRALRYTLLFIGVGATYLSIYFSYIYLATHLSTFNAFILAVVMVVYGVASFELMTLLWMRLRRFLAGVFAVLWLVVTVFSMASTIAGQYNGNMARVQADAVARSGAWEKTKEYEQYRQEREELQTSLADARAEDKRVEALLLQYKSLQQMEDGRRTYNQLRQEKRQIAGTVQTVLKRLEALDKGRPAAARDEQRLDFYMWVGAVLGIRPDVFQFWLSLFPALFIDLAAPFSIAVFLFVRDQEV